MIGKRKRGPPRCKDCGLHETLCACASLPKLHLALSMLIVQNDHERNKPTNTGRLVRLMIENAELVRYAVRGEPFDPAPLLDDGAFTLVFPRMDERGRLPPVISREVLDPARRNKVVLLDGTWGQCSRMGRRIAALAAMPAYCLPEGRPSRWTVREASDPSRVSTADAAIRVIRVLEGDEPADRMQSFFDLVTARMLFMKGKLPSPEVPVGW